MGVWKPVDKTEFGLKECSKCEYNLRCQECIYNKKDISKLIAEVKADTVREMQEQLKMEIDRFGRKDGFITKETVRWFIDQIAKEMSEGV